MSRENDAALVRECQAGNPDALWKLYDRHGPGLLRYLERMVADASLAEDFCQEAFLRIWRKLDMFDPDRGSFSAWLYRAASNLVLNRMALRSSSETTFETANELRDEEPGQPLDTAASHERDQVLHRALARLNPRDRAILTLRHLEEKSVAEVAVILEIPEGTVKSRVHYALRRLKSLLEERLADG